MRIAALFLALAAVATAAPAAVQPLPRADAVGTVTDAVGTVNGLTGSLGSVTEGLTGGLLGGLGESVTDLTGKITEDVLIHTVGPLLSGEPTSVVNQVLGALDDALRSVTGPADIPSLTATLEPILTKLVGEKGVIAQVLQAVQDLLEQVLNPAAAAADAEARALGGLPLPLPLPLDLSSLPLGNLPIVGDLLKAVVVLLNKLLGGLNVGSVPSVGDLTDLSSKLKAITDAVNAGKVDGVDPTALQQTLGPLLTTVDGVLQGVSPGNKDPALKNAEAGVVGDVGNLLTTLGAREGLDSVVHDLLSGLKLDGVLAGLVSSILALGNGILAPLLGGNLNGNILTNLLGGLGVSL